MVIITYFTVTLRKIRIPLGFRGLDVFPSRLNRLMSRSHHTVLGGPSHFLIFGISIYEFRVLESYSYHCYSYSDVSALLGPQLGLSLEKKDSDKTTKIQRSNNLQKWPSKLKPSEQTKDPRPRRTRVSKFKYQTKALYHHSRSCRGLHLLDRCIILLLDFRCIFPKWTRAALGI